MKKMLFLVAFSTAAFALFSCESQEEKDQRIAAEAMQKLKQMYTEQLSSLGIAPEQYNEALIKAVLKDDAMLVQLLLQAGADINTTDDNGNTPLTLAAATNNAVLVEFLVTMCADIDVNQANSKGLTPLYVAAVQGQTDIVRLLLEHSDIDIHKPTNRGRTPLQAAEGAGHTEIIRLLRNSGAR